MNKIVLLILCFILSSCNLNPNDSSKQILRLTHLGADPKTFNPWISSDASSSLFASMMFHGLIITDPDTDEPLPHMAESFQIEDSGKTIIMKLREGLRWSDNQPITAEDVEYTWNTLIRDEVAVSSLKDILTIDGQFPEVQAVDERTVIFKTTKVFAPFLKTIGIEIAPKHDIERFFREHHARSLEEKQKVFNEYLSVDTAPDKIVCSGAFKLHKIHSGERIELVANPNFFLKDEAGNQLPYLDKVIYSYVRDSAADTFKFLAGESYVLDVSPQNASLIKGLEQRYNFTLYDTGPSTGTNFIWFNLSKNIPEPKYSWFNNAEFRRAVSYAIDRDNIINNVFQGLGEAHFTAESLKSPYLNTTITGHRRDLNRAKEMLLASGFHFNNNSTRSELELLDAHNNRVEFNLFTNAGNQEREFMAVIIVNNLKDLGIKVNFKLLEFNNFVARLMQGKDYEAGIIGLTGGNEPNNGANVWKSDGRMHMFDVKKFQEHSITRDWEQEINNLLTQGVQVIEFNQRKYYYDKLQEIVYQYNPLIYIASPKVLIAVNNKVKGVRTTKYQGIIPYIYKLKIDPNSY